MIAIIDYDAGNLKSVEKALLSLGEETLITRDRRELLGADKVILPGVGSFGDAMGKLRAYGLEEVMDGRKTVRQAVQAIWGAWDKEGWKPFCGSFVPCGLARPRIQELYACIDRFRG